MSTDVKGKIIKRKNQLLELGVDSIDNTAPVQKILDELQHQNSQALAFYSHNVRQRHTVKESNWSYHYAITGHPLYAFPDDWDGDLNSGYFESFPYKGLSPKMITKMYNIDKSDPVTDYMKTKADWSHDVKYLRNTAVSRNLLQKYESLNDEVVQCPKHIINMSAHIDSDPDPYFNDSYNWYYAGNGNMQLMCVDWVDYLLYSVFSSLYITKFDKDHTILNLEEQAVFSCEGNNILETISSSQNIITLRTTNKVYIVRVVSLNDTLKLENMKMIESELPFTSISFDNHHKNILYVGTLDNKLKIINLDRLKARTVNLHKNTLVDNWSTVLSSTRGFYIHASKNSITIYDKRTNKPNHTWKGVRDITDDYGCNDITVAKQQEGSTSLYFGTDHHLFLLDLRNINKSKPKVVQRWTHGMQCVPTYMSISNFEFNKEIICLSSQWCEDTCVITNYIDYSKPEIRGITMPYRPPSILTLYEAQQKVLRFDLHKPIESRLCTAITGNMIVEQGENYHILVLNSLGDITTQMLYPDHMEPFVVDETVQRLQEWCQSYQVERKNFEVSAIVDIKEVLVKLRNVPESHIIGKGKLIKTEEEKFNESEIHKAFESEELDSALLDVWTKNENETNESSLALNLHYSDSE